ncbi:hypothetical protein [Bradyrhizobium sp. STM 3557]|uniref:hypothetical protein n=1 Tax=Bradyrhizobium sp. STM 3557 TaxID=578920 RepID=UPI00388CF27A
MAKTGKHETIGSSQTVRNTKTGQFVTVRGVGALKGQLSLKKGVDLTKPIASQALKGGKSSATHKR